MAELLTFTAIAIVLLIVHTGLDQLRKDRPVAAGALFGSIGTIPTIWLLDQSLPSAPELVLKMLLSGSIWAAVAWLRVREQRRRYENWGQQA